MAEKLLLLCRMGAKDAVAVALVTVGMGRTGGALETLLCRLDVVGTVDTDAIELRRAVRFSHRVPPLPAELLLLR